jgi:hypothetical protein
MPNIMGLNQLLAYQIAWWIFATGVAIIASLLFWNKGAAKIEGSLPLGVVIPTKLGGAAAIWVVTLLLFNFVNPMKAFTDANGIMLTYLREDGAVHGPSVDTHVDVQQVVKGLLAEKFSIELIHRDYIFYLLPDSTGRYFHAYRIPPGRYLMRVTDTVTTKSRGEYDFQVPPPQ